MLACLPNVARQHFREQVPVTTGLIFLAVTHQRDVSTPPELLDQPQSELLTVILDPLVGFIEANAAVKQFTSVSTPEIRPTDLVEPHQRKQLFARPKICHPRVIPGLPQPP